MKELITRVQRFYNNHNILFTNNKYAEAITHLTRIGVAALYSRTSQQTLTIIMNNQYKNNKLAHLFPRTGWKNHSIIFMIYIHIEE